MPVMMVRKPRVVELAERIEADIRRRKLQPGSSYLTTAETARMLNCSTSAGNRALQLLVQRRVLERKPRKGAIIMHRTVERVPTLRRVYLLVQENFVKTEGLLMDGTIIGMQSELPGIDIQFNFLLPEIEDQNLERLFRDISRQPDPVGLVLIRSGLRIQRLVAESSLPAVIFGSPYPSITTLSWLDRNHADVGRLLADYALRRQCRRLIVLMRSTFNPGDYHFLDAIQRACAAAAVPADQIVIRSLPSDQDAVSAEVDQLLHMSKVRTGIIARSIPLAQGAHSAITAHGMKVGDDIDLLLADFYRHETVAVPAIPYLVPTLEPHAIGVHIARMLAAQCDGKHPETRHEIIPIRLQMPE